MTAQFVPALIWMVVFGVPVAMIVNKAGLSNAWSVLILIPLFGPALLVWIIAFRKWPAIKTMERSA
jgi:hypothetical protein